MAPSERELASLIALARRVVPILTRVRAAAYPLSPDEDDAIVDFGHAIARVDNAKPTILPPGTVAVDRDHEDVCILALTLMRDDLIALCMAEVERSRKAANDARRRRSDIGQTVADFLDAQAERCMFMARRLAEAFPALEPTDAAPPVGEGT